VGIRLRGDLDAALVLVVATEFDAAVHLGDDRAVLRTTSFEQFGHARQTAGDVAGLGAFGRDTRDDVARLDLVAVGHRQNGADGQQVTRVRTARQLGVAVALGDAHGRTQVRAARAGAPVGDDALGDARGLVRLFLDRQAFDQVLEAHHAAHFREDRGGVGVPLGQALVLGHLAAVLDAQARAVRHLVGFAVLAVDGHGDHDVAAHGHRIAMSGDNGRAGHLDDTGVGRLEERGFRHLGRTADVEGPHRQLGARLADRLGGDDADRFADVDVSAARQVAAVAHAADARVGFTGQGRTDLDGLDADLVDQLDLFFLQIGVGREQDFAARLLDVLGRVTAQHALAQRDQDVAALDHGAQGDAARGTAVFLGDDGVLRHVHQTTGQVTRVGGLQGGVGQTLTGAVGGVEVLQH